MKNVMAKLVVKTVFVKYRVKVRALATAKYADHLNYW